MYAEVFEQAGALDKLEGFASFYGADFYGLPRNTAKIHLQKQPWTIPAHYADITPLLAGESLSWQLLTA
jgi:dihydroorotase